MDQLYWNLQNPENLKVAQMLTQILENLQVSGQFRQPSHSTLTRTTNGRIFFPNVMTLSLQFDTITVRTSVQLARQPKFESIENIREPSISRQRSHPHWHLR